MTNGTALTAAALPEVAAEQTLSLGGVEPMLAEVQRRWQSNGVETAALAGIDVRIADLDGATLGLAEGNTIWLDDNAAGWGWFVDPTPRNDREFRKRGDQGEQGHMDLLTVLAHEFGHMLGHEHDDVGVMAETLPAGERHMEDLAPARIKSRKESTPLHASWLLEDSNSPLDLLAAFALFEEKKDGKPVLG